MKPLISICIPTYNRAHYLGQTIDSVLNQTYKNFELIIWNDDSSDNTEEVIRKYKDNRITYHKNEKNNGYITTMNKCTRSARGDWIMHLSDDDLMLPTMLLEMVDALNEVGKKQVGFIVPQTMTINQNGDVISVPALQFTNKKWMLFEPKEFIFNFTLYGKKIRDKYRFNTSFPSTLFNKKILKELGMSSVEVPVSHDVFIESKICLLYPVLVIDKPLLKYRVHPNWGSSLNKKGSFLKEYQMFLSLLFKFVDGQKLTFSYDFKKYCIDALVSYLISVNGGIVRLAARFDGPYVKRLWMIQTYMTFALKQKRAILLSPQLYFVLLASLFPQRMLLVAGKLAEQI